MSRNPPAVAPHLAKKKKRFDRAWFYRNSRMLHAYMSAFAFIALSFFSLSGLLLNHPDWFKGRNDALDAHFSLSPAEMRQARQAAKPAQALSDIVAQHLALKGEFKDGEVIDGVAQIRFEGVSGKSDLAIDMASGKVDASIERATLVTMLHDLHRGKNSGAAWRWVIDLTAIIVLVLSVLGYVLFFSLRFRLTKSLVLTAASVATMGGIIYLCVP